jgi:hypothetical protein
VASFDFSVVAWEVQTTMHFAEKRSAYDPFDVQVIALQDDLGLQLRDNPATVRIEDAGRVLPWHVQPPRAYLFQHPYQAVSQFFIAVGERASDDAASAFWSEARVPTFGSPPEKWERLSDTVKKVGGTGAFGMIVVGLDEPIKLLLVLGTLMVVVNILDPVTSMIGIGVAEKLRQAFDLPTEQPPTPRRRKRSARGRRTTRPADG